MAIFWHELLADVWSLLQLAGTIYMLYCVVRWNLYKWQRSKA